MCLGKLQFNILDWDFIFHYQVFEKLSSVILRIFDWRRNFCQPSVALGQETAIMSHTNLLYQHLKWTHYGKVSGFVFIQFCVCVSCLCSDFTSCSWHDGSPVLLSWVLENNLTTKMPLTNAFAWFIFCCYCAYFCYVTQTMHTNSHCVFHCTIFLPF